MKVLFISLLRLGDIIIHSSTIAAFKKANEDAEVHVLINDSCQSIQQLLPYVNQFHHFERALIQQTIKCENTNLFTSYHLIKDLIISLNKENYDIVFNLTNNEISGYFTNLLNSKSKIGLNLFPDKRVEYNSSWFEFLNKNTQKDQKSLFHFSDFFYYGCHLPLEKHSYCLSETNEGKEEARSFCKKNLITIQPLSSTTDKDIPIQTLFEFIDHFKSLEPNSNLVLLGAPFEEERLNKISYALKKLKISHDLALLSLSGALSLLRRSFLLVTTDTSIKHFASSVNTQIIELCYGWSNPFETGAYGENHIILKTIESIPGIYLALLAQSILRSQKSIPKILSMEYQNKFTAYQTEILKNGLWHLKNLINENDSKIHFNEKMKWFDILNLNSNLNAIDSIQNSKTL